MWGFSSLQLGHHETQVATHSNQGIPQKLDHVLRGQKKRRPDVLVAIKLA